MQTTGGRVEIEVEAVSGFLGLVNHNRLSHNWNGLEATPLNEGSKLVLAVSRDGKFSPLTLNLYSDCDPRGRIKVGRGMSLEIGPNFRVDGQSPREVSGAKSQTVTDGQGEYQITELPLAGTSYQLRSADRLSDEIRGRATVINVSHRP